MCLSYLSQKTRYSYIYKNASNGLNQFIVNNITIKLLSNGKTQLTLFFITLCEFKSTLQSIAL